DFSVTLEWQGFLADAESAFLGMDQQTALHTVNRAGFSGDTLATLIKHTAQQDDPHVPLLSEQAWDFFYAERLHPRGAVEIAPSFGVLIVLDGAGRLRYESGELPLQRGDTAAVPYAAGTI